VNVKKVLSGPGYMYRGDAFASTVRAHNHADQVDNHVVAILDHVCQAGKDLAHAKDECGLRKGEWGQLLRDVFERSERTANDYITVYKHWNDPSVAHYRTKARGLASIRGVLDAIRFDKDLKNRKASKEAPSVDQTTDSRHKRTRSDSTRYRRQNVQEQFGENVHQLSEEAIGVLDKSFDCLWEVFYKHLSVEVNKERFRQRACHGRKPIGLISEEDLLRHQYKGPRAKSEDKSEDWSED
jgi:hypothetical protein